MSTDIDWQRELDTSFGTAPDEPVRAYVAAGRRAVRRRRAAAVVLAASVALGGTAAWAASPGGSPRGDAPVATQGSGVTDPDAAQEQTRENRLRSLEELRRSGEGRVDFGGEPAVLADGGLVLGPRTGAVLERVPNPMDYTADQGTSFAIRVMVEGRERYSLMVALPDSTSTTTTVDATGDFAGWLAEAVATQQDLDVENGVR